MRALVLYIPVLHAGYLKLFEKYATVVDILYILDSDLVKEFTFLEKEIRAIPPEIARQAIEGLKLFKRVELLDAKQASALNAKKAEIVTSTDSLTSRFVEKYLSATSLKRDTAFLRWDEASVLSDKAPEGVRVSSDPFDREMMALAAKISENSSDWWRHVGAVITKNGKKIFETYNSHVPSEHTPYENGDPRDSIKAGTQSHISTVLHSEQGAIVRAAREGVSLEGASIYTNVFPCPMCAKLIAYSGIKKCFFSSGHASLDGESILKANGVELVWVK